MFTVKLRVDVSGTVGDQAWSGLRQFEPIAAASFGWSLGTNCACQDPDDRLHTMGEWIGAEVQVETLLLAHYAVSHYLEQDRVLDADVVA